MKQPEFVRGARFASHAHRWEHKTGRAYVGAHWNFYPAGLVYSTIVWTRRRRIVR